MTFHGVIVFCGLFRAYFKKRRRSNSGCYECGRHKKCCGRPKWLRSMASFTIRVKAIWNSADSNFPISLLQPTMSCWFRFFHKRRAERYEDDFSHFWAFRQFFNDIKKMAVFVWVWAVSMWEYTMNVAQYFECLYCRCHNNYPLSSICNLGCNFRQIPNNRQQKPCEILIARSIRWSVGKHIFLMFEQKMPLRHSKA